MKNNRIYIYITSLIIGLAVLSGCNDLEQTPYDKFTDNNFWTSTEKASRVVNMAYSQMYKADLMWDEEALSDNFTESKGGSSQRMIRNGLADPSIGAFASLWKDAYGGIKTCHVYMDKYHLIPDPDQAVIDSHLAQLRFVRAFLYLRLTTFYGDVPFFTKDITINEANTISRTPRATVLDFIHSELDDLMKILPSKDQLKEGERGRLTKGAAAALQARAYLYENNWAQVEKYTSLLINNQAEYGTYSLFPNYSTMFLASNKYNEEVILDYGYAPKTRTWDKMKDMLPITLGSRGCQYAPTQSLVDTYLSIEGKVVTDGSYEGRDPRMAATLIYHGYKWSELVQDGTTNKIIYIKPGSAPDEDTKPDEYVNPAALSTPTGYYAKKYFDPSHEPNFAVSTNIIMIRYADILLMYAEAMFEQGKMSEAVWNNTIKLVRARAGMTKDALQYPSTADMQKLIRNERRVEFALEGLRWFDIKRWKIGTETLNGFVYGAMFENNNSQHIKLDNRRFNENRDYLWSVPRSQMDINPNLRPNNPGYSN